MALIYRGHGRTHIRAIAWSPDGARIASVSEEERAYLTHSETTPDSMERREILWALELEQERAGRTDGEPPDSAYTDAPLVWDAATGETFARYEGHPHGAHDVTWSRDGQRVLTAGGRDGCAHVWQAHDGQLIARYQDEERSQQAITILRQALEEPNERKRSVLLNGAGAVQWTQAARWVADDTRIIATCALEVFVWDVTTGQRLVTYAVHRSRVNMLAVAPDGRRAASVDAGLVHVWNAERRGSTLFLYRAHGQPPHTKITALAWSPDGTRIASGSRDDVHIWDSHDGAARTIFSGHRPYGMRNALAWSPDGARIVSGGRDGKVYVWDARTGVIGQTYAGHRMSVTSVAWSPYGRRVASADRIGEIHVWDVE